MMIDQERQPYLKTRHDLDFQFFGSPTVVHATGEATDSRFFMMEATKMPPGLASPYHVHHNEDEAFYILDGHVRFVCGGEWLDAGPGTWVYGPREIPHGFKVVGAAPARMLLMCAPAGFEKFVLELCAPLEAPPAPPDMAKLMAAAARFNIDLLGPLPDDPGAANISTLQHAIDRTRDRHMAAVNAGDAATATSLFAPDGILLPPGQPALEGPAAISGWFTGMFSNFRVKDFVIQPGSVEDCGDLIIEHGSWSATFAPKNDSSAMPAGGTYLSVYERLADGSVRYVRDTFNGLPERG